MDVQNIIKHRSIIISKSVTIGPDYLIPERYILKEGLIDSGEGINMIKSVLPILKLRIFIFCILLN